MASLFRSRRASLDGVQLTSKAIHRPIDELEMLSEVGELLFGGSIQEFILKRIQLRNDAINDGRGKQIGAPIGHAANEVEVDVDTLYISFLRRPRRDRLIACRMLEFLIRHERDEIVRPAESLPVVADRRHHDFHSEWYD